MTSSHKGKHQIDNTPACNHGKFLFLNKEFLSKFTNAARLSMDPSRSVEGSFLIYPARQGRAFGEQFEGFTSAA